MLLQLLQTPVLQPAYASLLEAGNVSPLFMHLLAACMCVILEWVAARLTSVAIHVLAYVYARACLHSKGSFDVCRRVDTRDRLVPHPSSPHAARGPAAILWLHLRGTLIVVHAHNILQGSILVPAAGVGTPTPYARTHHSGG